MTEKPVECSVPVHDWEQISKETTFSVVIQDQNDAIGTIHASIFRCKRCKILRFFSNK